MATSSSLLPETQLKLRALELDLQSVVGAIDHPSARSMSDMIRHHFGWSDEASARRGKRVRPLLVLLMCEACGGDWRQALPVASSVELIHNFSLVHDDIEDRSDTRRGRPTLWRVSGVPQAINTGDALFALSHLTLHRLQAQAVPPDRILAIQRTLDEACLNLTIGQHLDLEFENRVVVSEAEYSYMVSGKTSALLSAATACGALLAGATDVAAGQAAEFGRQLGNAFQALDDILGIWGAPEITGKPASDDLFLRKKTLPVVIGLARSEAFAALWHSDGKGPARIRDMISLLEACGSLKYAQQVAQRHTDLALSSLNSSAAPSPARGELENLAQRLLSRQT
jgi:geranylgeranyl diphosphate synthase type I